MISVLRKPLKFERWLIRPSADVKTRSASEPVRCSKGGAPKSWPIYSGRILSRGRNLPTYRWARRPGSNSSRTSQRPARCASWYRRRCSPSPTKSSNSVRELAGAVDPVAIGLDCCAEGDPNTAACCPLPDCVLLGTPLIWSTLQTQHGFPRRCEKHRACDPQPRDL